MQIMILGASRSSLFLMKRLIEKGHTCVLVDPKAQEIEQQYNLGILTINGIIIDIDILKEADIGSMDIVCAMSESENQNLMASEIARDIFNVKTVITRVFASEDYHIFDDGGFLSISSTVLTADAFLRAIDGKLKKEDYVGQCMSNIFGNSLAFTVIELTDNFAGAKVRDVEDSEGRHIFAIIRQDEFITTLPNMKLEKGDKLVLAERKV